MDFHSVNAYDKAKLGGGGTNGCAVIILFKLFHIFTALSKSIFKDRFVFIPDGTSSNLLLHGLVFSQFDPDAYLNLSDMHFGTRLLSYNSFSHRCTSRLVKGKQMLGSVYRIADGLTYI